MNKWIIITLSVLWLGLMAVIGVNVYYQYQVGRQKTRIVEDYRLMSMLDFKFKTFHDSLAQDVAMADSTVKELQNSYVMQNFQRNWLFIRIAALVLTLLTIFFYWFYYRKQAKD